VQGPAITTSRNPARGGPGDLSDIRRAVERIDMAAGEEIGSR